MNARLMAAGIWVLSAGGVFGEDAAPLPWNVSAECHMIVVSQRDALSLIPQFQDEKTMPEAWARLQEMITKGSATVVADLVARGESGAQIVSESVEELRYATQFQPPQIPLLDNLPKGIDIVEVLKNLPPSGLSPTSFESRKVGQTVQIESTVSDSGSLLQVKAVFTHTRLQRQQRFPVGEAKGQCTVYCEQPMFHTMDSTFESKLRNGQRLLLASFPVPEAQPAAMELFFLQASALSSTVEE